MKAKKATMRALPAILMLAAVVFLGNVGKSDLELQAQGWGGDALDKILLTPPASPLPCPVVGELIGISEQAAALTGSLALLEKDDRPQAATQIATEIRVLQQQAAGLPGGAELAWVLGDLAEALAGYARGNPSTSSRQAPAAIGDLREASARNAGVRESLKKQESTCGGEHNE